MKNLKMVRKWLICLLSFIIFSFLLMQILNKKSFKIDNSFYNFLAKFQSDPFTFIVKVITNLGGTAVIIMLAFFSLIAIKDKKISLCICLNLALVFLFNTGLKFLVARPRPAFLHLVRETGYSFPSGHAMVSLAFYGFLIYLLYKKVIPKRKWVPIIGFSILILAISISRIYLGVHYTTDVIAGLAFSLGYLIIYTTIVGKLFLNKSAIATTN